MTAVADAQVSTIIASNQPAAAVEKEKISGTITLDTKAEIAREGNFTISLKQVDPTRYKNYRQDAKEAHIMELMGLLKEHGQLNTCLGAWQKDGTIALVAGFCRFEAMCRLALTPLINEYNKFNNKEPADEGYIAPGGHGFKSHETRIKVREAGGDWTAKYDAALAGYNINFTTAIVEDETDAALMNIASNSYDKPPLIDLCRQIETLLNQGITGKRIAKALKMSETVVSLHRKINSTPAYLRKLFEGDISELAKKPEEQQLLRDSLMTAVGEFERRLSLEQDNPQSISYSHAREFAGAVANSKDPMTLRGIVKALKDLVLMSDGGKISEAATPDYTLFMAKLREAKRIGKEAPAEAAPGGTPATTGAAAAAPVAASPDLSGLSAEQMAQFDQAGAAVAPVQLATPAAVVSTGNPTVTTPTVATTSPTVVPQPAPSPEEQARQAEIDASNAEFVGTSTSSLLDAEGDLVGADGAGGTIPVAIAAPTDGQTRSKTTDAPVLAKYKNAKPPEKVELLANRMLDYATDTERATVIEQGGYLLASAQLFNACGLEAAEASVNEVFVNFMEDGNKYLLALENMVKEARGEATLLEMQQLRPKFVRPTLA